MDSSVRNFFYENKYRLANATTGVSKDLLILLRSYKILKPEESSRMIEAATLTHEGPSKNVAFDIYRKLESTGSEDLFDDLLRLFHDEDEAKAVEILNQFKKNLPKRKSQVVPRNDGNLRLESKGASAADDSSKMDVTITPQKVTNSKIYYYYHPSYKIGSGENSTVYKGYVQRRDKKIDAAVKIIDRGDRRVWESELKVWELQEEVDSPATKFIVTLLAREEEANEEIYLAMRLAKRNLLEEVTVHLNPFQDRAKIVGYLRNIAEALEWLHQQKILHRHIKPQNVLIYEYPHHETVAKLGEFGVSRVISKSEGSRSAGRGTDEWMSPEALLAKQDDEVFINTKMVDIFAFGMLSHFALTGGEHPFGNEKVAVNIRKAEVRPKLLECGSFLEGDQALQWMMQKDPKKRPTIQQVRHLPFLWTDMERLSFIKCVASGLNFQGADDDCKSLRDNIDHAYRQYYADLHHQQEFNWSKKIDPQFFARLTNPSVGKSPDKAGESKKKKSVEAGSSFMRCMDMARAKEFHKMDMQDDLFTQFLDEGGAFNEVKYVRYYLPRFPDMVILLFCTLSQIPSPYPKCIHTRELRDYLDLFPDCGKNWTDPVVGKFLSLYFTKT